MSSSLARAAARRLCTHSTRNFSAISASTEHVDLNSTTPQSPSLSRKILETPVPSSSPQLPVTLQTPARSSYAARFERTLRSKDAERIWAHYIDITRAGPSALPHEYHQQVLKMCIPSPRQLRLTSANQKRRAPHPAEGRLQTIIGNIRAVGRPSKDDYHLVLEQFAAVGHHFGALHVFREMAATGINLSPSTYLLVLQAIAHRLTLPEPADTQKERASTALEMLNELTSDMRRRKIVFTPGVLDLSVRIVKDAGDMESFEELIKLTYGIDMSSPDRLPLESVGLESPSLSMTDSDPLPFAPLSTAALNTILNAYGSTMNVSKLVQAFEVLTTPLPASSSESSANSQPSFDDDDDFGIIDNDTTPSKPLFTTPTASPNTTSFSILLRWLCKADEVHLCRHYFLLAMDSERRYDIETREALRSKPFWEIPPPSIMVDGHMVRSMIKAGRRVHRVATMRWIRGLIPTILKRKREAIQFYRRLRWELVESTKGAKAYRSAAAEGEGMDTQGSTVNVREAIARLDKQVSLVRRDINDIEQLREFGAYLHGREREWLKDRLGRRVWEGKNVYDSSTDARIHKAKEEWPKGVHYPPVNGMAQTHMRKKHIDADMSARNKVMARKARRLGSNFFTSKKSQMR